MLLTWWEVCVPPHFHFCISKSVVDLMVYWRKPWTCTYPKYTDLAWHSRSFLSWLGKCATDLTWMHLTEWVKPPFFSYPGFLNSIFVQYPLVCTKDSWWDKNVCRGSCSRVKPIHLDSSGLTVSLADTLLSTEASKSVRHGTCFNSQSAHTAVTCR